jgi:hypothetical protein
VAASRLLGYFTVLAAHADGLPVLELDEADTVKGKTPLRLLAWRLATN